MVELSPRLVGGVKSFEGYRATPFWDYKQYTSGYGTKAAHPFETIDQATAESRLQDELSKAAKSVDDHFPNLPAGQRDALTSLTYNAGPGWMNGGLGDAIRNGNTDQAKALFAQYNHAGGEISPGLTSRRQAELGWWGGQTPNPPASIPQTQLPQQPRMGGLMGVLQQAPPQSPKGGLLSLFPQGAPQQPPMAPNAQGATPQAAGQIPSPSIWDMLSAGGGSGGFSPNLPLFAPSTPVAGDPSDPAGWFRRQNTMTG